jgi:hypothetical protein
VGDNGEKDEEQEFLNNSGRAESGSDICDELVSKCLVGIALKISNIFQINIAMFYR